MGPTARTKIFSCGKTAEMKNATVPAALQVQWSSATIARLKSCSWQPPPTPSRPRRQCRAPKRARTTRVVSEQTLLFASFAQQALLPTHQTAYTTRASAQRVLAGPIRMLLALMRAPFAFRAARACTLKAAEGRVVQRACRAWRGHTPH